jgi:DNA-nicking Smr family endonuclease
VAPLPGRSPAGVPDGAALSAEAPPPPAAQLPRPAALPPVKAPAALAPLSPAQAPAGLDRRSADRMKKGEMAIEGRLDLHGMTQDAAHAQLAAFVSRAWEAGKRCVLVITGKGGRTGPGVLRREVPRWLNQAPLRERIIGISQARQKDGGDGALYVLIRRRR